jgi:hypothetical protein
VHEIEYSSERKQDASWGKTPACQDLPSRGSEVAYQPIEHHGIIGDTQTVALVGANWSADRERWLTVRDQIYEDVIANGLSNTRQSFVQYYGGDSLDASNLIMPLVFFMAPSDPKMLKTLDAIYTPPDRGGLVANNLNMGTVSVVQQPELSVKVPLTARSGAT